MLAFWQRMRRRSRPDPILGRELYRRVLAILREEIDELIDAQRVELTAEEKSDKDGFYGEIEIESKKPDAARLAMTIYHDTIVFGPGQNGANFEIWSVNESWSDDVRGYITRMRDGRFSEQVLRRGFFFPLRVNMRFAAGSDEDPRDYKPKYASVLAADESPDALPTPGEYTYEAW